MKQIDITARMEHVRTLPITVYFDTQTTLRKIRLQPSDGALLLDVFLSVDTGPTSLIQGGTDTFRFPENIKIGIEFLQDRQAREVDLTPSLLTQLRTRLDALDPEALAKAYGQGMEYMVNTLVSYWQDSKIAQARQQIIKYASTRPISKQLTMLGTRSADTFGGALSLSNFLYSFIALPPISLGQILSGSNISIQDVKDPCISVAYGSSDSSAVIGGHVDLLIEGIYHNELIDEFDRLEHKITPILMEVHQQLATDGPIVQSIAQANNSIIRLVRQLNDFELALADQNLQIQSIARSNGVLATNLATRMDTVEKELTKATNPRGTL